MRARSKDRELRTNGPFPQKPDPDPVPPKVGEPTLQPSLPEASRDPALRLVEQPVAAPQRPGSILVIDDNHHHRIPLLRALREQRHSVLYATDSTRRDSLPDVAR